MNQRRSILLAAIRTCGGHWTTSRAWNLYRAARLAPSRRTARTDLQHLARTGHLTTHTPHVYESGEGYTMGECNKWTLVAQEGRTMSEPRDYADVLKEAVDSLCDVVHDCHPAARKDALTALNGPLGVDYALHAINRLKEQITHLDQHHKEGHDMADNKPPEMGDHKDENVSVEATQEIIDRVNDSIDNHPTSDPLFPRNK